MFNIARTAVSLARLSLTVAIFKFPSATRDWLESVLAILSSEDSQITGGSDFGDEKQLTAWSVMM